jgi:hypothetical protein
MPTECEFGALMRAEQPAGAFKIVCDLLDDVRYEYAGLATAKCPVDFRHRVIVNGDADQLHVRCARCVAVDGAQRLVSRLSDLIGSRLPHAASSGNGWATVIGIRAAPLGLPYSGMFLTSCGGGVLLGQPRSAGPCADAVDGWWVTSPPEAP